MFNIFIFWLQGLTNEEIEVAVKRAGVQQNNVVTQGNTGYQDTVVQQGTTPEPPIKGNTPCLKTSLNK